jgi:hypothetical protein
MAFTFQKHLNNFLLNDGRQKTSLCAGQIKELKKLQQKNGAKLNKITHQNWNKKEINNFL